MEASDWKLLGVGIAVSGLVSAGCFYLGYKRGKTRVLRELSPVGKSYERKTDPVTVYVSSHNTEHAVLSQLRALSIQHQYGRMTSPVEVGKLLTILIRAMNARKVIDIGVFTGCSAFAMALGLPDGCKVIACDISEECTSLGKPYWAEGGVADKIDLRLQPATKTLQELLDAGETGTFDLMFIDADKVNQTQYYELGFELMRPGGLIVVDNALWSGRVVNPKVQDPSTAAIRKLNDVMKKDSRLDFVLLNLADGIGIGQKLPS